MLSIKDIEEATFRKSNMKGYKTDDVDDFLDEVKESFEKLMEENTVLKSKLSEALEKNRVLASDMTAMRAKMEDYKSDGDEIKHALISAHKTADLTIREAKAKANEIIAAAQKTADDQLGGLGAKVEAKEKELETMKQMVSDFRNQVFDMYKEHLAMIDNIPAYVAGKAVAKPAAKPVEEPVEQKEEIPAVMEEVPAEEPVQPAPEEAKPVLETESSYDFSSFISSADYRSKKRGDLKFGDAYDISKDK